MRPLVGPFVSSGYARDAAMLREYFHIHLSDDPTSKIDPKKVTSTYQFMGKHFVARSRALTHISTEDANRVYDIF